MPPGIRPMGLAHRPERAPEEPENVIQGFFEHVDKAFLPAVIQDRKRA
jgi:hypothetical protein